MKKELKTIIEISKEAGKILMKYYKKEYETNIKNNDQHDFVTTADKESEKYIIENIKKNFPRDYILSEETEENNINYNSRVWMIDPLDGTKNFIHHGKDFVVMIGLCINGEPKIGVVYSPVKDILYYGEKNKGSYKLYKNKISKLKVGKISNLKDSRLITRSTIGEDKPEIRPRDIIIKTLKTKEKIPQGSIGGVISLIAENKGDLYFITNNRAGKWDTCSPQVILEEAGGKITDFNGNSLDYKQKNAKWENYFAMSNRLLHKELLHNIQNIIKKKNLMAVMSAFKSPK